MASNKSPLENDVKSGGDDRCFLLDLPQEIVLEVISNFTSGHGSNRCRHDFETLKVLRLVNRVFSSITSELVFEQVTLNRTFDEERIRLQSLATSPLLQYIRVVRISPTIVFRRDGFTEPVRQGIDEIARPMEMFFTAFKHPIRCLHVGESQICEDTAISDSDIELMAQYREVFKRFYWTLGSVLRIQPLLPIDALYIGVPDAYFTEGIWFTMVPDRFETIRITTARILLNDEASSPSTLPVSEIELWNEEYFSLSWLLQRWIIWVQPKAFLLLHDELIYNGVDFTMPLPFGNRLERLCLDKLFLSEQSLASIFTHASRLCICALTEIWINSRLGWMRILDHLASIETLEEVDFLSLGYPLRHLPLQPMKTSINKDKFQDRVLESSFQEDYDALERLIRTLLGKPGARDLKPKARMLMEKCIKPVMLMRNTSCDPPEADEEDQDEE